MTPSNNGTALAVNPELLDDPAVELLPPGVYPAVAWDDQPAPERLELFRCNGRVYTVRRKPDPRLVFRFIRSLKLASMPEMAMADMMYELLGGPVVDALADNEDLTEEQMDAVMKAATKYLMGAMNKAGLGN